MVLNRNMDTQETTIFLNQILALRGTLGAQLTLAGERKHTKYRALR